MKNSDKNGQKEDIVGRTVIRLVICLKHPSWFTLLEGMMGTCGCSNTKDQHKDIWTGSFDLEGNRGFGAEEMLHIHQSEVRRERKDFL